MTPHQWIGGAVRLFAIWLLLKGAQTIVLGIEIRSVPNSEPTLVPFYLSVLYFLMAVLLWLFPLSVAHKLLPKTKFTDTIDLPSSRLLVVGCTILGLLRMLYDALPSLTRYFTYAAFVIRNDGRIGDLAMSYQVDFFVNAVQFVVGLILVINAPRICAFITSAQVGRKEYVAKDEDAS